MPVIAPFAALRYSAGVAGHLSKLVAPPYDVISPAEQDALYAAHPNNVVRLILAKDGAAGDRYQSAAKDFAEWKERGILAEDKTPGVYLYTQRYSLPTGEDLTRQGFIALLQLEELGQGVKAHERTFAAPLEDRVKLMTATDANLSQVFALYRDPQHILDRALAAKRGEPVFNFRTPDGVYHALSYITDAGAIGLVQQRLANDALIIADGHHRYEAALRYRNDLRLQHPNAGPDASFEYLPVFLCNTSDPGLQILATHRLLAKGTPFDAAKLRLGLEKHFFVTERLMPPPTSAGARLLVRELREAATKGPCFAVGVPQMPTMLIAILRPNQNLGSISGMPASPSLQKLDVIALHALCLEQLLGISSEAAREGAIEYEHDTAHALGHAREGTSPAAFFLPPPRIEQVFEAAEAGERMPHKSTYFFPKLASGLILRRIDPAAKVSRS